MVEVILMRTMQNSIISCTSSLVFVERRSAASVVMINLRHRHRSESLQHSKASLVTFMNLLSILTRLTYKTAVHRPVVCVSERVFDNLSAYSSISSHNKFQFNGNVIKTFEDELGNEIMSCTHISWNALFTSFPLGWEEWNVLLSTSEISTSCSCKIEPLLQVPQAVLSKID